MQSEHLESDARFTQDERDVWLELLGLVLRLPPALDIALRETGDVLLVEYIVLSYLAESPDHSRRMSEIAKESHLSPSRTTHLVTRLEKRGLIERHPEDNDKRAVTATVTNDGLTLVERLEPIHTADARARVFDKLTAEQVDQLRTIARAVASTAPLQFPLHE